jgi:hypothetical protein
MLVVTAGRRIGAIPPGPPPQTLALAYLGALGGVVNHLDEQSPFEELLAEKAALGVLGLAPMPTSIGRTTSEVADAKEYPAQARVSAEGDGRARRSHRP